MQVVDLVEKTLHIAVVAAVDRCGEMLEDNAVDVRPRGEEQVVLHRVERRERVAIG